MNQQTYFESAPVVGDSDGGDWRFRIQLCRPADAWTQRIGLKIPVLNRLLSYDLTAKEACDALARFGIVAVPFDIAREARNHLGKPYIWGASFKKNLVQARVGLAIMFEEGRPCSPVFRKICCPFFATWLRNFRTHRRLLDRRW